jgi:hypothetical protein
VPAGLVVADLMEFLGGVVNINTFYQAPLSFSGIERISWFCSSKSGCCFTKMTRKFEHSID